MNEILELARKIAEQQGSLGDSPAEVGPNAELLLCAASCIVDAGLRLTAGIEEATAFRASVLGADKNCVLPRAFERCGLDPDLALFVIKENDSRPHTDRLPWFCALTQGVQRPDIVLPNGSM